MRPAIRSLAFLLSLTTTGMAFAQVGPMPVTTDSGVATYDMENFSGGVGLGGSYFDVRHQASSGVGYQNGFTQFGLFAPLWVGQDAFIAPNARLILTDDKTTGLNAGLVARGYSSKWDRIFGFYSYYDLDESQYGNNYDQISFGVESLGERLDVRGNVYLPFDEDTVNILGPTGLSNQMFFFEHRIGFFGTELAEKALTGGDFEFGMPVLSYTPWLRAFAGMYFYDRSEEVLNGDDIVGFRGRLEGWVSDDLSVGVIVTTDSVYDTNVNAVVDWRFAGFKPTRYWPQWRTSERMLMPVQRHWRVTVDQFERFAHGILAYNPRDDQPYFVVWVDNSNTQPGDGTFENPYRNPPPVLPNETDLVLYRRGKTTAANPLNGSIILPDYARMLGEGREHVLDAYANFAQFSVSVDNAPLPDPAFTNTGLYPFLTAFNDIVRVNNHNEVSAFVLENAGGAAIAGSGVNGFHFNHLEVTNNAGGGIVLSGARGTGAVTIDGQVIDSGLITDINRNAVVGWSNPMGLGNNGPAGIDVSTGASALNLNIFRTTMNGTGGGQDYGIRASSGIGALNLGLLNTQTNGNVIAGVSVEQGGGDVTAGLSNVTANSNAGHGIEVIGNGGVTRVAMDTISASANGGSGINVSATGGNVIFNGVDIVANANAANNLNLVSTGSAINVQLFDSQFNRSVGGAGVGIFATAVGGVTFSGNNLSASNNAVNGFNIDLDAGALNLLLTQSVVNRNVGDNLNLTGTASSSFVVNIINSQFNNSQTGSGLAFSATNGSAGAVTLDTITAISNAVHGVGIFADNSTIGTFGNAVFDGVNVLDSNLSGNSVDAINVVSQNGAYVELFVDPTNMSFSGRNGLRFEVLSGAGFVGQVQDGNLNFSGSDAVFGSVDSVGSFALLGILDSTLGSAGDDGLDLSVTNSGTASVTLTDSTLTNAAGRGLAVSSTTSGVASVTMLRGGLDNAGSNAVFAGAASGGTTSVTLTDLTGDNAASSGVLAQAVGGTVNLEFDTTSFSNSGSYGLRGEASAAGTLNACILNSTFDVNPLAGVSFAGADDGTEINVHFGNSTANSNSAQGLAAFVETGADINFRAVDSEFNGNGNFALPVDDDFDGVFVRAQGTGTVARLLFSTSSANDNARDGFHFEADDDAYMTARIDNVTATGNGRYGVYMESTNGAIGVLIPTGTNDLSGNGVGPIFQSFNNTGFALVQLSGSFNNMAGDGVHVEMSNVGTAIVTITGDGTDTIDNNGGHGIFIDLDGDGTGSAGILVEGYASISGNGLDGVHIELSDFTSPSAVELQGIAGLTQMLNNGDDGFDITMTNVALGNFGAPAGLDPLSVLTLTDNDPANDCLPEPVDVAFNTFFGTDLPSSDGVLIDSFNIDSGTVPVPGQDGISVVGIDISGTGGVTTTNNTISNYDTAINVFIDPSSIGLANISNNIITNSLTSGISLVAQDSFIDAVTISGNSVSGTLPTAGDGIHVEFFGTGNGFTTFTADDNTIDGSLGHGFSLTGMDSAAGDVLIRNLTVSDSALNGINVAFTNGSLQSVMIDGENTATVTDSGNDGIAVLLTDVGGRLDLAVVNYGTLHFENNPDFGMPGEKPFIEVFDSIGIDNSGNNGVTIQALGTDVNSLTVDGVAIDNSGNDGLHLRFDSVVGDGVAAPNGSTDPNDYEFKLLHFLADNSGNDGVRSDFSGSTGFMGVAVDFLIGDPEVDNDILIGMAGGQALNINQNGGQTPDYRIDPTFTGNYGSSGLNIIFSNVNIADGITVDHVNVTGAMNHGVNIQLTNVTGNANINFIGAGTILNSGGDGIHIEMNNVANNPNVSINDYTINGYGANGIFITNPGTALGNVSLTNNTVMDNGVGQEGIELFLGTSVNSIMLNNNSISNSGTDGVLLNLVTTSGAPDVSILNTKVNTSGKRGINMQANNVVLGDVIVSSNNVDRSNGGQGIFLNLGGTVDHSIDLITLDKNRVSNSFSDGIRLNLNRVVGAPNVTVSNSGVSNSLNGYGILVAGNTATLGNVHVLGGSGSVLNSKLDGIRVDLASGTATSARVSRAVVHDSGNNGIAINLASENITSFVAVNGGGMVQNSMNGDGIFVNFTSLTGSPQNLDVSVAGYDVINSSRNGIALLTKGLPLSDITLINNDVDRSNGGSGILVDLAGSALHNIDSVVLNNNTASRSFSRGIDLRLQNVTDTNATGAPNVTISNSSGLNLNGKLGVSDSGDFGILVGGSGAALNNLTIDNAYVSNSATGGIRVDLAAGSVNNVLIREGVVDTSLAGHGIHVFLNSEAVPGAITVTDTTAAAAVRNSSADGIRVDLLAVTGLPDVGVNGYDVVNSGGRGIHLNTNGLSLGDIGLARNNVDLSNGGEGIFVNLNGSSLHNIDSVTLTNNTVSRSSTSGINVGLTNVTDLNATGAPDVRVTSSNVSNSGRFGIIVTGITATLDEVEVSDATVSTSVGDNIRIDLQGGSITSAEINNANVNNSTTGGGLFINLNSIGVSSHISIDPGTVTNSLGGDGIRINTSSVTGLPDITVDGYTVTNSLNRGIAITTNGVPLGDVTVSNNTVSNSQTAQGILVDLNRANSHTINSVTMLNNSVSGSGTNGVELRLNNVTNGASFTPITIDNTTIADSTNFGMLVTGVGSGAGFALGDVSITDTTITNTVTSTTDGLSVNLSNGTITNSVVIDNANVANSGAVGINVNLTNITGGLADVTITSVGNGSAPSTVADSGSDGIRVNLNTIPTMPDVTIDGYSVANSTGRGIALLGNGLSLDDVTVSNNTVVTSGGTHGILVDLNGGAAHTIGSVTLTGNSVTDTLNAGTGIEVALNNVTGMPDVNVNNTMVTDSLNFGLLVNGTNAVLGDVTVNSATIDNSVNFDGISIDFTGGSITDTVTVLNVNVADSGANGVHVRLDGGILGVTDVTVTGSGLIDNSGDNGILVEVDALGAATRPNLNVDGYTVANSLVGNGIAILTNAEQVGTVTVGNSGSNTDVTLSGNDGIFIDLTGSTITSVTVDNTTVDSSNLNGIEIVLDGVTGTAPVTAPNVNVINNNRTNSSGGDGITNSTGFGILVTAVGATLGDITFMNDSVDSSVTADGVRLELTGTAVNDGNDADNLATILFDNVSSTNNSGGTGINVLLSGITSTAAPPDFHITFDGIAGTTLVDNNGADGISILLNNTAVTPTIDITNYTVSNSGDDGVVIQQVGAPIGLVTFAGNTITGNATHGVDFQNNANPGSAMGLVTFNDNTISLSGADGVHVVQPNDTDGVVAFNFNRNVIDGNGTSGTGRGINFSLPNTNQLNTTLNLNLVNNSVTNNRSEGVRVEANAVSNSNVTANVNVLSSNVAANTLISPTQFSNDISGNGGIGLYLQGNNTVDFVLTIGGQNGFEGGVNTFNANTDAGVGIELSGSATATTTAGGAMGITFNGGISNASFTNTNDGANTRFFGDGFGVSLINNSDFFDWKFGDDSVVNTTFSGNQGSGLFVDAGNNFATVSDHNGDFVSLLVQNSIVANNQGLSTGGGGGGLTFHRNAAGQIGIVNGAPSTPAPVVITGNTITGNRNGIDIEARSQDMVDSYTITNNLIDGNNGAGNGAGNGIRFFVEFDADITATINDNTITNNRDDGIQARENAASTDNRVFRADMLSNILNSNGGDGMEVTTVYEIDADLMQVTNNGQHGFNLNGLFPFVPPVGDTNSTITRSIINNNGQGGVTGAGIQVSGAMDITIANNDFANGGSISNNLTQGVEIHMNGGSGDVEISDNLIQFNGNDGIQLESNGGGLNALVMSNIISGLGNSGVTGDGIQIFAHGNIGGANDIIVSDNMIEDMGRRGINVVNAGVSATNGVATQLDILMNDIQFSQFEAIYIINTTEETQGTNNIDTNANILLDRSADGSHARIDPRLALNITDNFIQANGQNGVTANFIGNNNPAGSTAQEIATGIVLRVSTSDAGNRATDGAAGSFQDNGGVASSATSASLAAGGATLGAMLRGGVLANIGDGADVGTVGNIFVGQFGADVTFQPFISVDTNAAADINAVTDTTGDWTDNNNNPRDNTNDIFNLGSNTYLQDPLARLDLRFTDNTGDGLIATRIDTERVWYNNAEALFKSRTQGQDGNDPPVTGGNGTIGDDGGPFTNASRLRNATRLANHLNNAAGDFDRPRGIAGTPISDINNPINDFHYPGTQDNAGTLLILPGGGREGSTFRLSLDSWFGNVFTTGSTSFFGQQPLTPTTGGGGELPFRWDDLDIVPTQ